MQVPLNNVAVPNIKRIQRPCQKYAFSLATGLRLHNEGLDFALDELLPQVSEFGRQEPGLGEEIVLFWKLLPHFHEISAEVIFPGE